MNKKIQLLILTALILFLITACLSCSSGSNDDAATTTTTTIAWQPDADGFLQYSTNDTALYSTSHYHTNNTIQTTMTAVEAQVKRISGSATTGYGIAFCYQDVDNFYQIVIVNSGHYLISKKVSGIYYYYDSGLWVTTNPSSWPSSSQLNAGFDTINNIKVVNAGGGVFDVYFNGLYETSFTDTTFTGGDSGYFAYVSSSLLENFPSTPADMRFKQIDPDLSMAHSVQRILWQNDGAGFVQFVSNDTNDCGYLFTHAIGSPFTPMSSVEIQIKKVTGSSHNSYGNVFCYQDQNNYYRVGITVNGSYIINKKVAGTTSYNIGGSTWYSTNPSSWPSSSNLNTGFGITNNIKVVNAGGGVFDVYFNDIYETSFTASAFTGGYNGYSASVNTVSNESFPTPVDVRARLIAAY
ncbi:MAG: hypothetical protein NTW65_04760 [Deltaproteobacteria bacterium]|nr:hypothetical protein [Deltaproteobacteria bacterium]